MTLWVYKTRTYKSTPFNESPISHGHHGVLSTVLIINSVDKTPNVRLEKCKYGRKLDPYFPPCYKLGWSLDAKGALTATSLWRRIRRGTSTPKTFGTETRTWSPHRENLKGAFLETIQDLIMAECNLGDKTFFLWYSKHLWF